MLDSLFEKFERIVVLDTETTGIDCKKDEIIELAAASVTPGGIESEMDVFIRLSEGRKLPSMITQLTGITPEMLPLQGVEKWEAAAQFAAAISHPNTLIVAYNAQFDLCFLYYFLARLELADVRVPGTAHHDPTLLSAALAAELAVAMERTDRRSPAARSAGTSGR